jgi:GMP synthase-like glutamine amidotransferase
MRVVAFRHEPSEDLGHIRTALDTHGIAVEYADLYDPGAPVPDAAAADGLIFLGGPMSVNDDLAWLRQEERFLLDAVRAGKPVLGICLGAQLIAHALGATVRRNPSQEVGWFDIAIEPAAREDALFAGCASSETVFHWHGETFDLPAGAALLASSAQCRHQAFRLGANIYGLQFHLEVTPAMIADWCRHAIDPHFNAVRLATLAQMVFGGWCGLLSTGIDGMSVRE